MRESTSGSQDFKPKPLGDSVSLKSLVLPLYKGPYSLKFSVILPSSSGRGVPLISGVLCANIVWALKQLCTMEENRWLLQNSLISSGMADFPGCNLKQKSWVIKKVVLRN